MSDIDSELTGEAADDAIENDAHVDGADQEQQFTPPEGMEAELYDNGALSADKVKERIDTLKSEVETAKTNEANMRKNSPQKAQYLTKKRIMQNMSHLKSTRRFMKTKPTKRVLLQT